LIGIYLFQLTKYIIEPLEINNYYNQNSLINYSAGFIRRGLSGELLKKISLITKINISVLLKWSNVILFLSIFSYFLYEFIKNKISVIFILLPYVVPYLFKEYSVNFKDMFSIILLIIIFRVIRSNLSFFIKLTLLNILSIIGILNHEMFLFQFLPISIFLFCYLENNFKIDNIIKKILQLAPSLFIFYLCFQFKGTQTQSVKIFTDINNLANTNIQNLNLNKGIEHLNDNIKFDFSVKNFNAIWNGFSRGLIYIFFVITIVYLLIYFNKLKFSIIKNRTKFNEIDTKFLTIVFILLIIFLSPVFIIALDWFRFLNLSLLTALLISIIFINNKNPIPKTMECVYKRLKKTYDFFLVPNKATISLVAIFCIFPHYKFGNTPYQFSNVFFMILNYLTKLLITFANIT